MASKFLNILLIGGLISSNSTALNLRQANDTKNSYKIPIELKGELKSEDVAMCFPSINQVKKTAFSISKNMNLMGQKEAINTDSTLIIKIELTSGGPGSDSYKLSLYSNGFYEYINKNDLAGLGTKHKKVVQKDTLTRILKMIEKINVTNIQANKKVALGSVHDGQQTNVSIWNNGLLREGSFGNGNPMPEDIKEVIDSIFLAIEN